MGSEAGLGGGEEVGECREGQRSYIPGYYYYHYYYYYYYYYY